RAGAVRPRRRARRDPSPWRGGGHERACRLAPRSGASSGRSGSNRACRSRSLFLPWDFRAANAALGRGCNLRRGDGALAFAGRPVLAYLTNLPVRVNRKQTAASGVQGRKRREEGMASVEIRDVRKAFGATEVIHGVDIVIEDGAFVVLVGPSGCGKSTLLRMIAGLENITGGQIKIGERVVNDLPPKARDTAMVFQNYALYPHMTVADN